MTDGIESQSAVSSQPLAILDEIVDTLSGAHPALTRAVEAIAELHTAQLPPDQTAIVLTSLVAGPDGIDLLDLIGRVVAHLGDPASNAGLRALPASRGRDIRLHTGEWHSFMTECAPRELIYEASWDADPSTLTA